MANRNNQTNVFIKWAVIAGDLLLLNALMVMFRIWNPYLQTWSTDRLTVLWVMCNLAMIIAQCKYSTIIHLRIISGGDILQRVFRLTVIQTVIAYMVMKAINVNQSVGWLLLEIGLCQMIVTVVARIVERYAITRMRQKGRNVRTAVFVGVDPELLTLYNRLQKNPTYGYQITGYYADEEMPPAQKGDGYTGFPRLGSLQELMDAVRNDGQIDLGDEVYVCLSRHDGETLRVLADYCDQHLVRFYFVPKSVESIGMRLKRKLFDDIEMFTTHEIPLEDSLCKVVKRVFDIAVSFIALLCMLPIMPIVALVILIQSPGPVFFRQTRTGGNGKDFICYKFRSMHVNKDADKVQATENDPRKFPFGDIMRKYNIDELPQFWNVLKGDMSVVGPRPHMLYHTELYKKQIGKYMVRHFVKPGITGWAQVTGFRGETKELWQMEERVRRDIWYIENWSIWLDLRIMWMTLKSTVGHDKHAY
ncbi:MAG: undecaprenyl-phosphate glucose phosphotransferase [Prevotellaceae bacterium]|nr:undecaprenyl-phosphate glucose phosphotransferase [Prevotellaceae bacterium]